MPRRALIVFPEGESLAMVEELRRRFDPLAQLVPAHITLVFPYVDTLSATELQRHIREAVEQRPAFDVRIEGTTEAEGEYLLLPVAGGREALIDLHHRLYRGPLAFHLLRGQVYQPHITIGRVRDEAARASALALARAQVHPFDARLREMAVFRLEGASAGAVELTVPLPPAD